MKHSILITTGMIAGLLFASSGATAASHGDKQRIYAQKQNVHKVANKKHNLNIRGANVAQIERMIRKGTKSGQLTNHERRKAKAGLNSLKATIKAVKQDRRVTRWEKKRVQNKSAQLKRRITRLINNRVVAKRSKQSRHFARR